MGAVGANRLAARRTSSTASGERMRTTSGPWECRHHSQMGWSGWSTQSQRHDEHLNGFGARMPTTCGPWGCLAQSSNGMGAVGARRPVVQRSNFLCCVWGTDANDVWAVGGSARSSNGRERLEHAGSSGTRALSACGGRTPTTSGPWEGDWHHPQMEWTRWDQLEHAEQRHDGTPPTCRGPNPTTFGPWENGTILKWNGSIGARRPAARRNTSRRVGDGRRQRLGRGGERHHPQMGWEQLEHADQWHNETPLWCVGYGRQQRLGRGENGTILKWDGSSWNTRPAAQRMPPRRVGHGCQQRLGRGVIRSILKWDGRVGARRPAATKYLPRHVGTDANNVWAVGEERHHPQMGSEQSEHADQRHDEQPQRAGGDGRQTTSGPWANLALSSNRTGVVGARKPAARRTTSGHMGHGCKQRVGCRR